MAHQVAPSCVRVLPWARGARQRVCHCHVFGSPRVPAEGGPGSFICGVSPPADRDPDFASVLDLRDAVDHDLFTETVWPSLFERCEAFGALKVTGTWAGFYEYNTVDQVGGQLWVDEWSVVSGGWRW